MIDLKRNKTTILAVAMLAILSPASWAQEKGSPTVDTVHVSQPRTQDLGADSTGTGKKKKGLGGFGGLGYSGGAFSHGGGSKSSSGNKSGQNGNDITNNKNNNNDDDDDSTTTGTNDPTRNPTTPPGKPPGGFPPPNNPKNPDPFNPNPTPDPLNPNPHPPGGGNPPHGPLGPFPPFPSGGSGGGGGGSGAEGGGSGMASPQSNQDEAAKEFTAGSGSLDESWPGGCIKHVNNGSGVEVTNQQNQQQIAAMTWPFTQPPFQATMAPFAGSQSGKSIMAQIPAAIKSGGTPATASEFAAVKAIAQDAAIESLFQPNSWLQTAKEVQNTQTQQNADNSANMEKQQASCAIDFVRSYLENFTANSGNQWNRLRNELFMPMAVLLLLPGAVATQAKATIAQGFPIFGDISPVEGLYRSIVSIFLIPGTYLIVNYGIDVSNSIAYTISSEYQRIFGSDMYRDAMCAHIRAFGSRLPTENLGHIPKEPGQMQGQGNGARAKFEGGNLDVKLEDPCSGLYQAPENKANEKVPYAVNSQRAAYNGMGAALAMTWNILCAFQMCYLYYLWFVGPIMAALWVWPVKQLREAFPNWCEGVITICFWSLFWNTTILLMACFRGIDDTGTVIMEALNFLSTACVKFAFDFAGLVKAAGAEAGKMAEKAGKGGGGGKGGGQKGGDKQPSGDPHKTASHKDSSSPTNTSMSINNNNNTTSSTPEPRSTSDEKPNIRQESPPTAKPKLEPPSTKPREGATPGGSTLDARGTFGVASIDAGTPPMLDRIDPGKIDVPTGLAGMPGGANMDKDIANMAAKHDHGKSSFAQAQHQAQQQALHDQQKAAANDATKNAMNNAMNVANETSKQMAAEANAQQSQKAQQAGNDAMGQLNQQMGTGHDQGPPITGGGQHPDVPNPGSNPLAPGFIPGSSHPPQSDPLQTIKQAENLVASNNSFATGGPGSSNDPNSAGNSMRQQLGLDNAIPGSTAPGSTAPATDQGSINPSNPPGGNANFAMLSPDMAGGAPMAMQDPRIVDLPGGTSTQQVETTSANSFDGGSMARSSNVEEGANLGYYTAQNSGAFSPTETTLTPSTPTGQAESMARGNVDEQRAAEIIPMAMNQIPQQQQQPQDPQVIQRQQQDQIIQERKIIKPADDQSRRMNQQVDQQKMLRNAVPQKPEGQKPMQGGAKPLAKPGGKPVDRANDTQKKADAPLMDQVKYGSILRRSRGKSEMSEDEEELMRKLAGEGEETESSVEQVAESGQEAEAKEDEEGKES